MNIQLSAEAQVDLRDVWEYSRSNWGLPQADLYPDQILLRIAWLPSNPGLWRPRPELGKGLHCYPEQRHVIFFRKTGHALLIARVMHQAMDPSHMDSGNSGAE
jgi:toxin ParE1/3/4